MSAKIATDVKKLSVHVMGWALWISYIKRILLIFYLRFLLY